MNVRVTDGDMLWHAVVERDPRFEGLLWYGVVTTGIYCRPTCPSRRPSRTNVRFFTAAAAARDQGLRPCKRCRPDDVCALDRDRSTVLEACRYVEERAPEAPPLKEVSAEVGLSPGHFQKLFKRVLGISPKQYADSLRFARLRAALGAGDDVAGASFEAGFGSSSRLYEQAATRLGMTPATYRHRGRGERIRHTVVETRLGPLLVAATDRGLCSVRLGGPRRELESGLRAELDNAAFAAPDRRVTAWARALADYLDGEAVLPDLPLDVAATAFQARVWSALRAIPAGTTATYTEIAAAIGAPRATRAVARACATNPVALVVPCHRVVPKSGGAGGYRWGAERKRALLEMEATVDHGRADAAAPAAGPVDRSMAKRA